MERIDELTPELEALIVEVRDEWVAQAIGGDSSMHVEHAVEGVRWLYDLAKLKPPEDVLIADSPFAAVMWARDHGAKDLKTTDRDGLGYWSGLGAWIDFYRRAGLDSVNALEPTTRWLKLMRSGVWDMLLFERIAIVVRRPDSVMTDSGRLHNPTGPAVRFRDGYTLHAWRGIVVPADWIEKKTEIDPSLALTHTNLEQRRALCEILGWDKVLEKLKSKEIDRDIDPEIGTLLEVDLPGVGASRFLRVRCGTGRAFVLAVPATVCTAREANAWGYALDVGRFDPEVRT